MSAGSEDKTAVVVAQRVVVLVNSDGVGVVFLFGKRHLEIDIFINRFQFCDSSFEIVPMFRRYGEVQPHPSFVFGITHSFGKMFYNSGIWLTVVFVEKNQCLGLGAVAQEIFPEQAIDDGGIVVPAEIVVDVEAAVFHGFHQFLVEGEFRKVVDEHLDGRIFLVKIVAHTEINRRELRQILEHT